MKPGKPLRFFNRTLFCLLALLLFFAARCDKGGPPAPISFEEEVRKPLGPSPLDGKGTASIAPPLAVRVREARTWHITYKAAKEGIQPGGGVWFQIPPFWEWTPPQTNLPQQPGYVTASTDASKASISIEASPGNRIVLVTVKDAPLREGEHITVCYGDDGEGKHPTARALADRYSEEGERFFIKVDGDGDGFFHPIDEHPAVTVLPREIRKLTISAPSFVKIGEPFQVTVAALDGYLNRAEDFIGKVKLFGMQGNEGLAFPEEVSFEKEDRGAVKVTVTAREEGIFNLVAEEKEMSLMRVSNPILSWKAYPEFKLVWGDLQGHSNRSDGSASPRQFHEYARDVAGLEVVALTDHDHHGILAIDDYPQFWEELKKTAAAFNDPGKFVAFSAYEWTNWDYGHKHVIFLKDDGPLLSFADPRYDTPAKLWKGLKGHEALTISHHTGWGEAATDWDFYDPLLEPVVEIYSVHGSSEFYGCDECVRRPKKGSFVHDALARGYRLGIVGSGDTHSGHPGLSGPPVITGGLAGIYTRDLTREGIFEALRARRVFGTSGSRIILDFRINGAMMGSQVKLSAPDEPRQITVMVVGHKPIENIDILKNNQLAFSQKGKGVAETLTLEDPEPAQKGDFYTVRITQSDEDKEKAWSSPIWIELQ